MKIIDLDDYSAKENPLRDVWDALSTPVLKVCDRSGTNIAEAQVRHLWGDSWIYVDEVDGFSLIPVTVLGGTDIVLSPLDE